MFDFLRSHPDSVDEILENQGIEDEELVGFENELGFSLEGIFDEVEKVSRLPQATLSTLKGRGSATIMEGNDIILKYREEPDLAALARNGVYAEMMRNSTEDLAERLPGDPFEDLMYTEFVASLAEEKIQGTELTREERDDFQHARESYEEVHEAAIEAILDGAADNGEEMLELETIEELGEHRGNIRDMDALVGAINFSRIEDLYQQFANSDMLEHGNIRGSRRIRESFEDAVETYQLARGVIAAREAARKYLERGGGLIDEEERGEVLPSRFLEPDRDLFRKTVDYLNRVERSFVESPAEKVEIDTPE